MNVKATIGVFILITGILPVACAFADTSICQQIHQTARQFTVNGQSDIPETVFAVAGQKRVQFYSAPDVNCKSEGRFVVAGDVLRTYKRYGKYTWASYTTVKGENIPAWVNTSALSDYSPEKVNPRPNALSDADFIVVGKARWFGLGSSYSRTFAASSEREIASSYIGDFPNELGGVNKFSSHEYAGLSVVSSNIGYDSRLWEMDDDYIIQAIKVTSADYKTTRGIRVGDGLEDVHHAYNGLSEVETAEVVTYRLNGQSLSFDISDGKVASVNLTFLYQQ